MSKRPPAGQPLPGYPRETPLPRDMVAAYYEGDRILCLLCGRPFRSVGHHIVRAHGVAISEYQDRYGLPRGRGLVSKTSGAGFAQSIRRTIEAGRLDEHFRKNAARSQRAAQQSVPAISEIRALGIRRFGTTPFSRAAIESVLSSIEAGATAATAVKRAGLSWSGFHGSLRRHADLHARYKALPIKKGRTHGDK